MAQDKAVAKDRSAPNSKAAKTKVVAKTPVADETPVLTDIKQMYLDCVWMQRTIQVAEGRRGMVIEVNFSRLIRGLPSKGESFTICLFRPDGSMDPDTIRRVDGTVLARIQRRSWQLFPPRSPFVNDPYVENVCVPATKAGWRWTEDYFNKQKAKADARWQQLENQADQILARNTSKEIKRRAAAGNLAANFGQEMLKRKEEQEEAWQRQRDAQQQQQQDTAQAEDSDQEKVTLRQQDLLKDSVEERSYGLFVEQHYQQLIKQKEEREQQQAGSSKQGRK